MSGFFALSFVALSSRFMSFSSRRRRGATKRRRNPLRGGFRRTFRRSTPPKPFRRAFVAQFVAGSPMTTRTKPRRPVPAVHAPDLGAQGPAALARPTIDTEVRTRGHGKIVARTVLSQPLDVYAHDGHISDAQLEAGHRVAKSLRSWQASRVTARYPVASDPGLDDDEEDLTDEEREQQRRANRRATRLEAEHGGTARLADGQGVCEGYFLGRLGSMALLREGLQALVVGWKIPERVVESA